MLNAESGDTQAGLFSAVSSAFIIDVQSKLEPDPNDTTAAYLRILIHTMNNSLFPDADPSSAAWTGPPHGIVAAQSLLYASLTTSLFAAFLAMLGKQWVNRYLRNRGGSAADKSRDRQRKLDGFEKWHFHLAIESLPAMLQFALLLLGCALSMYLWTISRTVAGVVVAVTLFGVTSYVFLTLAATLHYNCPYQTPPSTIIRTAIRYLRQSDATFFRSLRSITAPLPLIKTLRRILIHLHAGVRRPLESLGCIPVVPQEPEHTPVAIITLPSPTPIFEDIPIDWDVYKADIRCISWVLSSSTDADVICSTARFAADMILYPEIVGALSPHILADILFDCLLDGRAVPGKSEHASSVGMALASVLSTQLTIEPESQTLVELYKRIHNGVTWDSSPEPTFQLVMTTLVSVANTAPHVLRSQSMDLRDFWSIPDDLTMTQKLWLSRIVLQTLWRRRRTQESAGVFILHAMEEICKTFTTNDDQILAVIRTNCFLAMAICLGLRIGIRDLHAPNNRCVIPPSF